MQPVADPGWHKYLMGANLIIFSFDPSSNRPVEMLLTDLKDDVN